MVCGAVHLHAALVFLYLCKFLDKHAAGFVTDYITICIAQQHVMM